jgi:hypothetical protein
MLEVKLRRAQVPATWLNIWEDPAAAARLRAINDGDETVPTVVIGTWAMVNPSARQVIAAVRNGQPSTRPTAGTRGAAWLAQLAGFLSGRPRQGSPRRGRLRAWRAQWHGAPLWVQSRPGQTPDQ